MVKFDGMFLVSRLNGKVVDVSPISDVYTGCTICLESKYLSDEDISKLFSHMHKEYQINQLNEIRKTEKLYNFGEAKDLTCQLSQYTIKIEYKELEFED